MTAPGLLYETLGSTAALLSAAAWALSSILFRRLGEKASPSGMNLGKCILGSVALGAIILIIGMKPVPVRDFIFLGLSGLLGIALGDTLFFTALMSLGPRLALLLGALGPVFTVILAVIFLGERPSLLAWTGIVTTIAGVNWVIWESVPKEAEGRSHKLTGIKYGVLSIFCNAAGIILAKVGVSSVSALDGTFIRFLWGMAGLLIAGAFSGKLKGWLAPFGDRKTIKLLLSAVFVAIFGGFWLFLFALKHIDVSIAVILNETAPLFVLPLAYFMLKEKISPRSVIGAAIAVSGVVLLFIH
ncbi:MAG: DMT family transporter [Elusimicrobia bacterium]|nr:DMT family transporter [Elusimicrobiota bacterium]